MKRRRQSFPPGWDERRVKRLIEHYEGQSEEEAIAEDEAAFSRPSHTAMKVPVDLVSEVRALIAKRERRKTPSRAHNPRLQRTGSAGR